MKKFFVILFIIIAIIGLFVFLMSRDQPLMFNKLSWLCEKEQIMTNKWEDELIILDIFDLSKLKFHCLDKDSYCRTNLLSGLCPPGCTRGRYLYYSVCVYKEETKPSVPQAWSTIPLEGAVLSEQEVIEIISQHGFETTGRNIKLQFNITPTFRDRGYPSHLPDEITGNYWRAELSIDEGGDECFSYGVLYIEDRTKIVHKVGKTVWCF